MVTDTEVTGGRRNTNASGTYHTIYVCSHHQRTMSTSTVALLNRADLDSTLARVTSKPNVSGALILARENGAIIRSTVADDELANKYSLGVKSMTSAVFI